MRISVLTTLGACLAMTAALAQDAPPRKTSDAGAWRAAASEPDAEGGLCSRAWICVPQENIGLKDPTEDIHVSATTRTRGKCLDDECRICQAPPPTAACSWTIVQKASAAGDE